MNTSTADIEEAVDAVLQDAVLAAEQSITATEHPGYDHSSASNESGVRAPSGSEFSSTPDQMQSQSQASEGQHAFSTQGSAAFVQLSPVSSAINPLFQPSHPVRLQSAQLQQNLSSLTKQLSDLEASMQSPQTADATLAETAVSSHRPGELCQLNEYRSPHICTICNGV